MYTWKGSTERPDTEWPSQRQKAQDTMTRTTKAQQAEQNEAIERLRALLPVGSAVYCNLRHVSRSGMMRHISFHIATDDGIMDISWLVAKALDYKREDTHGALKVGGCGMDMGFHIVNSLSYAIHGMESKGEPTTDHTERRYWHDSYADAENYRAGYTLRSSWL
jgi:hypothetical protein